MKIYPPNKFRQWQSAVKMSAILILFPAAVFAQTRIKDIAMIKGLESHYVTGIGIVNGLKGTGDGTQMTALPPAFANMAKYFGQTIDPNALRTRNSAYVFVSAEIPPFAKRGTEIDVTVSSAGDAQSLEGGFLVNAVLVNVAADKIIAEAQGPISIGGLNQQGGGRLNFSTTGRVINGARILQDIETSFDSNGEITLFLLNPDFTTASRVVKVINERFGPSTARATDPATIDMKVVSPSGEQGTKTDLIEFISAVEQLTVDTDLAAVVVINERTGTVIAGGAVTISPVLISHGDLTIQIRPPQTGAAGQAAQQGRVVYFDEKAGATVADLASALNALQVTPRDLISIFQALKTQGALKAILKIN